MAVCTKAGGGWVKIGGLQMLLGHRRAQTMFPMLVTEVVPEKQRASVVALLFCGGFLRLIDEFKPRSIFEVKAR